ncbi:DUF2213 domain-containing protein [Clostridium sporogenes]|uniref:DUF2213 domain-containing protein n=1 Tax=Clostridium sporogenes TaxID=1509 RepID=UPI0013D29C8B|nr:DUF2213 domain-containing protein [Clostridium sporogenes]NFH34444.1 DUF2213 domain-containing protein [Clostridium sporogenes]NFH49129.1 DUF2213 domain-containing protein [Clostridium sporogenes]NFL21811.1 DUF2213 domain-containing protein [Clostridium sporogenes]NFN74078.1 DUF2213 domain-containing protein [Clostridium sporogenes]NFV23498.1 DUF2213 domain-containing protein [Clostridium sporogenes]
MRAFYGSRFSPNMTRTPEGFLICHNVPIARTGWYEYLPEELGIEGSQNELIKVYRDPDEVFSKTAIASFEGKPVTDEHPPDLLTADNSKIFIKGTTQNVRQDKKESDLLIADLIIYDSVLIDEVDQGKREVSCGYECDYKENEDGTYSQIDIRGNHVAVVEAGRAGNRVSIKDSKNNKLEGEKKVSKKVKIPQKKGPVTNILTALGFKHYAADAEPDEISNTLDQLVEERGTGEDEEIIETKENKEEKTESKDDNPEVAKLTQQVSELSNLVGQLIANQNKEKAPEEAIDEVINKLEAGEENTVGDEEESVTVPVEEINDEDIPDGVVIDPEDRPKNPIPNADSNKAMAMALKAMKPIIANMSNPAEKKKACDSLLSAFKNAKKTSKGSNGYADILKAQRKNAMDRKKAEDEKAKEAESIGEIYKKKFNPHYKEVK